MTGVSITQAVGAAVPLTTGADPVTADTAVQIYAVTSGGTGGTETITLPTPDLDLDSFANGQWVGRRVVFFLEALTNPSDAVTINVEGQAFLYVYAANYNAPLLQKASNDVTLDFLGAMAAFVWCGSKWKLDLSLTSDGADGTNLQTPITVQPWQTTDASPAQFTDIIGGNNAGTGNGGDVNIAAGNSTGGGNRGNVKIQFLPTADPHVADAIWNNSGVLTVSAG